MHQINLMNRVYLSSGIFERKNNLIKIEQIYRGSSELEEFFIFCTKKWKSSSVKNLIKRMLES